jgi:glutamine---fructose-6-phosphate transaminase (isomerizing)
VLRPAEPPRGHLGELLGPLVEAVQRLEEGDRVSHVDQHRQAELAGRGEDVAEPLVVRQHPSPGAVDDGQAEVLPHLEPAGAGCRGGGQVGDEPLGGPVLEQPSPVELGERHEPAGVRLVVPLEVLRQLAGSAVEIDHGRDVVRVHEVDQGRDVGDQPGAVAGEPPAEVVVHVHRRVRGPRHLGGGEPELGDRRVVGEPQIAQVFRQNAHLQCSLSREYSPNSLRYEHTHAIMTTTSLTADEIASQPDVWAQALQHIDRGRALLAAPGERVLAIGCGTSAFVAMAYAALREASGLGDTDASYASEVPLRRRYDRVVAITRSGTTSEVLAALEAMPSGVRKVAVTAVAGEEVDRLVDDQLVLGFADERSVVQTRFPTALLALARGALGADVSGLVAAGHQAVTDPLAADPANYRHFVFLGSGWTVGLAHEAALKIREAAQAWSESYPLMDYRHGPIAVAGPQSLVTVFGPAPQDLLDAVAATGATVVTGGQDPLAQLVSAQRLAVALAAHLGLDPDHPRALTRSVILDHSAQTGTHR